MFKIMSFQFNIFKHLLRAKLVNFFDTFVSKLITFQVWALCTLSVGGYLMQSFGLPKGYGFFQLGGILATVGFFETQANVISLISDIEGNQNIMYYLTLPASAITVFLSYVCYYAIICISMSLCLLPAAKIILWHQMDLLVISWGKLFFFIVLSAIFYAIATLFFAAIVPSVEKVDTISTRILFPLWIFGSFQFSWFSVYAKWPLLSYIMLFNPMMYVTEGMRAALLGQEGNISYWLCCIVLLLLMVVVSFAAYMMLKKRLDFVE